MKTSFLHVVGVGLVFSFLNIGCGSKEDDAPKEALNREESAPIDELLEGYAPVPSNWNADSGVYSTPYCQVNTDGAFNNNETIILKRGHAEKLMSQGRPPGGEDGDGGGNSGGTGEAPKEPQDYYYAKGGGCVERDFESVWASLTNQELMKWDGVSSIESSLLSSPNENVKYYYEVKYMVDNAWPLPDVDWTMDWFHSLTRNGVVSPRQVIINFKKVRGTSHIGLWDGSMVIDYVKKGLTGLGMYHKLRATSQTDADTVSAIMDVTAKARKTD